MLQKLGFQPKSKSQVKIDLLPALFAVQEPVQEFIECSLFFLKFYAPHGAKKYKNVKSRVQFLLPALFAVQEQKTASLRSAGNRVGVGE